MSNRQVTIAVDAMGGENSPYKVLKGIEIFQRIIKVHEQFCWCFLQTRFNPNLKI